MKNKINFIKIFFFSDIFKIVMAIIIASAFMSLALYIPELISNADTTNYISRLCFVFSNKNITLFTMPLIILLLVIYLLKLFDYYYFYFIRFNSKKVYHKFCVKNIIKCYTLIYCIILIIFALLHLILKANTFSLLNYHISRDYYVVNALYLLWLIIKNYLLSILYIIINYLMLRILDSKLVIIANIIFIGSVLILNSYEFNFYLIYNFVLAPYFVDFWAELISFTLNFFISILSILLIYEFVGTHMKVALE